MRKNEIRIDPNDIVGKRFGKLYVESYCGIEYDPTNSGIRTRHWYLCTCSCGNQKLIRRDSLIEGLSKSCGCTNGRTNKGKFPNCVNFNTIGID